MADPQFKRELSRLLKDFKPQVMKWPDVVQRLRQLKALIKQYPNSQIHEADLLGKCLMECLHPSWPQGLHSEALDVYEAVLLSERIQPRVFDSEAGIYAVGLFSFYDIAAPENKQALLSLYDRVLHVYPSSAGFYMPGLIINLLSGLEDPGNKEAVPHIIGLFETLSAIDEATFHSSLWIAIMRTSSGGRNGGLSYLMKRKELFIPKRQLVLNTIISCLDDPDIRVKRAILDFIIAKMSLLDTGKFLDEEKVGILVAVLRLLGKGRDHSILRRVKDWIVPQDIVQQHTLRLSEYLAQAASLLLSTFSDSEENVRNSITVIESLLQVFDELEDLRKMLLLRLSSILIAHVYKNQNGPYFSTLLTLISRLVPEESSYQTWESLCHDLTHTIETEKLGESLNVIDFTLNYMPLNKSESTALLPILELILKQFSKLQSDQQLHALQVAQVLLTKVEDAPRDTGFQREFGAIARRHGQLELLKVAIQICIALGEPGEWVQTLKTLCTSPTPEEALIGIEGLCYIYPNDLYSSFFDSQTTNIIFNLLWDLISSPASKNAVLLFVSWQKLPQAKFTYFTCEKLAESDPNRKAAAVQQFAILWGTLRKMQNDEIGEIFYTGAELYELLEGLESESPHIRHSVREWLLDSLPTLRYIIDPFLEPLVNGVTSKYFSEDQKRNFYTSKYNTVTVLKSLKKVRALLLHGGEKVYAWLKDTKLSMRQIHISPSDFESSYLDFLVRITLNLVEGEADANADQEFFTEDQSVRFSACEVIERILDKSDPRISFTVSKPFLSVTCNAIQDQNALFQLQLLNILREVLLSCATSQDPRKCKELFSSKELMSVLVTSIESKDAYLQSHWTEFIRQLFPVALKWMTGDVLVSCTRQLTETFAMVIRTGETKESAFEGLITIINSIVDLLKMEKDGINMVIVEEHKTSKGLKEPSGWLSSFFSKNPDSRPSSPFGKVFQALVSCFESIFQGCYACLTSKTLGFHASPFGLELSDQPTDHWQGDEHSERIREVLMPLFRHWPIEFFSASLSLWVTNTQLHPIARNSPDLVNEIRLFSCLGLPPYDILSPLSGFLTDRLMNFQGVHDTHLMFFIATLLISYPSDAYPLSSDEQKQFSLAVLTIFEALDQVLGAKVEIQFWILELIVLISKLVSFTSLLGDKHARLHLQEFVRGIITKICRRCGEKMTVEPPFPPSIMQLSTNIIDTQAAAFRTLSVNLYPVLKLIYIQVKDLRDQLRDPVSILTSGLSNRNIPMHMLTSLLHALVMSDSVFITEVLRDTLTNTLKSAEFFESLEWNLGSLRNWGDIVKALTLTDSRDKERILNDILAEIPTGLFTSKESTFHHSVKALKLATFYIYSGEVDDYCKAVPTILDRIFNDFAGDEYLPSAFLLLRTITLRLSLEEWEGMYLRLQPYLVTRLAQALRENTDLSVKTAAMKLIELFSSLNYEQFTSIQWLFLFDTPNIDLRGHPDDLIYQPLLASCLLPGVTSALVKQDESNMSVYSKANFALKPVARTLFFTQPQYEDLESLHGKGEPFLHYMITYSADRLIVNHTDLLQVVETDLLYCG